MYLFNITVKWNGILVRGLIEPHPRGHNCIPEKKEVNFCVSWVNISWSIVILNVIKYVEMKQSKR